jgi:hypothetical protein
VKCSGENAKNGALLHEIVDDKQYLRLPLFPIRILQKNENGFYLFLIAKVSGRLKQKENFDSENTKKRLDTKQQQSNLFRPFP